MYTVNGTEEMRSLGLPFSGPFSPVDCQAGALLKFQQFLEGTGGLRANKEEGRFQGPMSSFCVSPQSLRGLRVGHATNDSGRGW